LLLVTATSRLEADDTVKELLTRYAFEQSMEHPFGANPQGLKLYIYKQRPS
jgi:hypothetical protein